MTLSGTTVTVWLDGSKIGSFAYNGGVMDGGIGALTAAGTASFDDVHVFVGTRFINAVDATPPVITLPKDVTVAAAAGETSVYVSDATLGTATATDNTVLESLIRSGVPEGNLFGIGTTAITWTATDVFGNVTYATQLVTVTPPQLRVSVGVTDGTGAEAASDPVVFTLSRTDATSSLTINLAWSGTAAYGTDYTVQVTGGTLAGSGTTLTLAAGVLTATLRVVPTDDTAYEGTEGVTLSVLSGVGYVLGNPTSVSGTIADNDTAPSTATVNLTATDAAGAEPGTNTITFTLTRTGVLTSQISVGLGWSGTATYGKDYKVTVTGGVLNAKGTAVTLLANATTATITVTPLDDTRIEPAETVVLTLKAGTGYTLGADRAATGTIADNDGAAASATTTLTAASAPSSDDTAPVATTPAVAPEASTSLVSPAVALTAVDGGTTVALDTTTTSGESSAPAPDGELETEPAGRPPGRKD